MSENMEIKEGVDYSMLPQATRDLLEVTEGCKGKARVRRQTLQRLHADVGKMVRVLQVLREGCFASRAELDAKKLRESLWRLLEPIDE